MLIYGFFINSMMAEERTIKIEVSSKDDKEQFCKRDSERAMLSDKEMEHRRRRDRKGRKCPDCDKFFHDGSTMLRHKRTIHEGITEFHNCDHCSYQSQEKSVLKKHIESVHEGVKRFSCKQCPYKTNWSSHQKRHAQKHKRTDCSVYCKAEGI